MWTSNLILSLGLLCFTNTYQLTFKNDKRMDYFSGIEVEYDVDEVMDDFSGIRSDERMYDFIGSGSAQVMGNLIEEETESSGEEEETESSGEEEKAEGSGEVDETEILIEEKDCKEGWDKFNGACYYFSGMEISWESAKESCENKNSRLADIYSIEENWFIRRNNAHYDLWIGGNDIQKEGEWRWTNGKRISFTNWEHPEPNNWFGEDCLIMRSRHGLWNDLHCPKYNRYVCKYNLEPEENVFIESEENVINKETEENVINEKNCKDGWKKFKNHCYYFSFPSSNWPNAKKTCANKDSYLADVHNEEENSFIRRNSVYDVWLGGNDIMNEGTWHWINDDKISYTNWENREPNNWRNEDCLILRRGHGLWNDYECYQDNNYVCKYKLDASVESSKEASVESPKEETEENVINEQNCKDGWKKLKNHCYYFSFTTSNWQNAQESCTKKDGYLADVHNKEENNFIRGDSSHDVWIGGNDKLDEGTWRWTNNDNISYTNWENREPNNWNGEDCLIIRRDHGLWNDLDCHKYNNYVCKYKLDASVESSKEASVERSTEASVESSKEEEVVSSEEDKNCKDGWAKFKNHCYYFSGSTADWNFAKTSCQEKGSYLADVYNKEENNFMKGNSRHDLWIGGNDKVDEGTWRWTNENKISYTNWENIEPNNWNGEDCLIIRRDHGLWNDLDCNKHNNYVCKYKLGASVESSKETSVESKSREAEVERPDEEGGLCRQGWISFGNSCYYFENILVNWDNAVTLCTQMDSHLVDIKAEEENYFLIKHTTHDSWTSGNDWQQEGDWRWGDGKPVTYKKWRYGEPNNARYKENCMVIIGVTNYDWIKGYWYDDPCLHRRAFICKYNREEAKEIEAKACVEEAKESFSGTENKEETTENFSETEAGSAEEGGESFSGTGTDSEETKEVSFSGTGSEETKGSFSGTGSAEVIGEGFSGTGTGSEETKEVFFSGTGSEETIGSFSGTGSESEEMLFFGSAESGINEDKETTEEIETPFVKLTTPEQFFFTEPEETTSANKDLCKNNWFPFMNSCYKLEDDLINWYEAEKECKSEGGHLVHVTNELVSKYLEGFFKISLNKDAWIGAKKSPGAINWAWTNELPVIYNNWLYPDSGPIKVDEECASIRGQPSFLSSNPWEIYRAKCNAALPFVCKKKANECDGWSSRSGHCIYFSTNEEIWSVAENICLEKNSTLIQIENADELAFLRAVLDTDIWIKGPTWHFIPTEDEGSDCLFLRSRTFKHNKDYYAVWKSESCHALKSFICESPLNNEALSELNQCAKGAPWRNPYDNPLKNIFGYKDESDLTYENEQCSEDIKCPPSFECDLKTSACCLQESIFANDNCLEGWERHYEACYLFRTDLQNWNDAHTECMQFSGHLADIQNKAELEYIQEKMHNAWIGDRHYINTVEENVITEEQGCPTVNHLFIKDSSIHHSKEECLYLRPYVCKYYIKSDDNEIHPIFEINETHRR